MSDDISPDSGDDIVVCDSADAVAEAVAIRLTAHIAELQQTSDRIPQVALTGGRIATAAYQHLAADGPRSSVAWSQLELWWGDERFVPADTAERNDHAALSVLRPSLELRDRLIHPMPADDGSRSLDQAAQDYASQVGDTRFDICLLGVGPDGHIASMFPEHPSAAATGSVIPVRDAPKPPPERISLTHAVINRSAQVWFIVAGQDKAAAVGQAMSGSGDPPVPAAGARGAARTRWLLDRDAASALPPDLIQRGQL